MKLLYSLVLIPCLTLNAHCVVAQTPKPVDSLLTAIELNHYDKIISYVREGYWLGGSKLFTIIALKGTKWSKISISSKLGKDRRYKKPKIVIKDFDNSMADTILQVFEKYHFSEMSNDSLERHTDSNHKVYTISDEMNYRFDLWDGHQWKTVECYAPEYFLKAMPNNASLKRNFISCRDVFVRYLGNR